MQGGLQLTGVRVRHFTQAEIRQHVKQLEDEWNENEALIRRCWDHHLRAPNDPANAARIAKLEDTRTALQQRLAKAAAAQILSSPARRMRGT